MRTVLLVGIVLIGAAPAAAQKREEAKSAPKPITLTGCVQRGESAPDRFTLSENKESQNYRLTGTDVRDYVGRRVQIVGGVPSSRRLKIVGGLTPSANAAAQAGAMDPARAAVASAGGTAGPGTVELPEFKVRSVRPVTGECPD